MITTCTIVLWCSCLCVFCFIKNKQLDKDKIILELMIKVDSLMKRVQQLEYFEAENKKLRIENTGLKHRLFKYEHPKNSNNSSVPPLSLIHISEPTRRTPISYA